MDWQTGGALVVVGLAAAYLGRAAWRTWNVSKGYCSGGCGCNASSENTNGRVTIIPADTLHIRQPDSRTR